MAERVGVIGAGYEGFRPAISDLSTRELMYEASAKAYEDAGVDPRKDVGSFICCTEDFWEGWSITDEMVPDQIGGAARPVCTVPADGIIGVGHALMHIRSGVADVVAVEAHSKAADVLDKAAVENLALDPVYHRVVGASGDVLAGLEMSAFMKKARVSREELSGLVKAERRRAMRNPRASYGAELTKEEVSKAEAIALPLRKFDKPALAEAGVVLVLASEKWIKKNGSDAVYVDGVAWRSSSPWFEGGGFAKAGYAEQCWNSVRRQAGVQSLESFDVVEADDSYSYKLVQHAMSMGTTKAAALRMVEEGVINPSGGSLGTGHLLEATGSHKVLECVLQLRRAAGGNQVKSASRALAMSWRGNPTATGAVVALSMGRGRA